MYICYHANCHQIRPAPQPSLSSLYISKPQLFLSGFHSCLQVNESKEMSHVSHRNEPIILERLPFVSPSEWVEGNESCLPWEWVMSPEGISHVCNGNESCLPGEWVDRNESCLPWEWVMSHMARGLSQLFLSGMHPRPLSSKEPRK